MTRSALGPWLRTFGLHEAKAKEYGIEELGPDATHELVKVKGAAYGFHYFDRKGKDLGILKVRLREAIKKEDGREIRYMQVPAGTFVYMPRGHGINWAAHAGAPDAPLVITEGEKKAHALCAIGVPCIALGGVGMWRKAKGSKELHPEIEQFATRGRKVAIVFDSDADKKEVAQQRALLKRALEDAGCVVAIATPPDAPDGSKNGIDDYLFPGGKVNLTKARERFDAMIANAVDPEGKALREMNEEWALIANGGNAYVLTSEGRVGISRFDTLYKERKLPLTDCMGKVVKTQVTGWWRIQRGCNKYDRVVFHTATTDPVPPGCLNLYAPPTEPPGYKRGSMAIVEDALGTLVPDDEERALVLAWAGYGVETGSRKLWAVFAIGGQGTGKTFLGNLLGSAFLPYVKGVQIGDLVRETFGKKHYERVRFLQADEGGDDEASARKLTRLLKHPITHPDLEVEEKYVPSYRIDNRALIYLSSNHRSIHVEPSDRRYFVLGMKHELPKRHRVQLNWWLRHSSRQDAPVHPHAGWALREYLLAFKRPAGFDEASDAPMTAAKAELIGLGRSGLERHVHGLMEDGAWFSDAIGKMGEVVTAQQLADCADPLALQRLGIRDAVGAIGGALFDAGCLKRDIKVDGKKLHLWAVRNQAAWETRTNEEWRRGSIRQVSGSA